MHHVQHGRHDWAGLREQQHFITRSNFATA
jgi:hypothetical protein